MHSANSTTKRWNIDPALEPEDEYVPNQAVHPSIELEPPWTYPGLVIGSSYVLLLFLCAFLNTTFLLWPVTVLRWSHILSARSCRHVCRFFENLYFAMLSGCLELLGGVKIILTGDEIPQSNPQEHMLLICNHRSEVDWIFFWNLALRYGVHDRIRVMLKSIIRYTPGVGWAMLLLQYPYVNRNWATDQIRLTRLIQSYREVDIGSWLAMFPEGTALNDKTLQKSQAYAEKQGEELWNYVLQPRYKGFELCFKKLDPEYVFDLTVAYPELMKGIRPSPKRIIRGQFSPEVHINVKRYHQSLLLKHKDQMGRWLKDRFAEKEQRLQSFYETGAFEGEQRVCKKIPLWSLVVPCTVFNLMLCGVALYLLIKSPHVACFIFVSSAALSIIQAWNFGD
ncbi:putative phospholipid/glycerol acyltransferase [Plasmopara halstedii]